MCSALPYVEGLITMQNCPITLPPLYKTSLLACRGGRTNMNNMKKIYVYIIKCHIKVVFNVPRPVSVVVDGVRDIGDSNHPKDVHQGCDLTVPMYCSAWHIRAI